MRRPALVVARRDTGAVGVLLWILMVTSAERAFWTGDVPILDGPGTGLRIASKVRTAKITTIEDAAATVIGRLDDSSWTAVLEALDLAGVSVRHVQ